MKIKDMEWRRPNRSKYRKRTPVNTAVCKLFNPVGKKSNPAVEELVSLRLVQICVVCSVLYKYKGKFCQPEDVNVKNTLEIHTSASVLLPISALLQDGAALPNFSDNEVSGLEKVTFNQYKNPVWVQQDISCITASTARSVLMEAIRISKGDIEFPETLVDTIMGRRSIPESLPAVNMVKHWSHWKNTVL